jgi:ureidoacrylate peracid hydrolase
MKNFSFCLPEGEGCAMNSTVRIEMEPEPLDIDLDRSALVIVDMQNAFVAKGGMFDLRGFDVTPIQNAINPILKIYHMARNKMAKVIYVVHVLSPDLREVGPDSSFWYKSVKLYRENLDWQDKFIIRGTWGAGVVEALKPQEGDLIVEKPRFSAFFGTNLDTILKTYQLKYLFFAGCATNICIEASIRDAANLGYFPILISDASINNGPPFLQDSTIFNVKLCFGWVTDTETLLEAMVSPRH